MSKSKAIPEIWTQDHIDRFWSKVGFTANPNCCWEWHGGITGRGYGAYSYSHSVSYPAHRIAFFLENKIDPKDLVVRHKCDNTKCCNPNHLEAGTHSQNTQDMLARKRHNTPIGLDHGNSRLSDDDVRDIRLAKRIGESSKGIAAKFSITVDYVNEIVSRRRRKYVI